MEKKANVILIVAFMLAVGVCYSAEAYWYEPFQDDLLYKLKLGREYLATITYAETVETFGDVLESQYNQYFASNGRTLVHILVQSFCGLLPHMVFSTLDALVFLTAVCLLMRLCFRSSSNRYSPLMWVLAVIALFYGMPDKRGMFLSIAIEVNYLWPTALTLGFLLIWQRLGHVGKAVDTAMVILSFFYGFITGWSHEGFALPLCAGTFIYAISHSKELTRGQIWMLCGLYAGAAILFFAPGNSVRMDTLDRNSTEGFIMSLKSALVLFRQMKIVWLLTAALLLGKIAGLKVIPFLKENLLPSVCLVFAILMGCAVNTLPQSFTGIELFSLILLFRLLDKVCHRFDRRGFTALAAAGMVLFIFHGTEIVKARKAVTEANRQIIADYLASDDGVVVASPVPVPASVLPYVNDWTRYWFADYNYYTIETCYTQHAKKIKIISPDEIE